MFYSLPACRRAIARPAAHRFFVALVLVTASATAVAAPASDEVDVRALKAEVDRIGARLVTPYELEQAVDNAVERRDAKVRQAVEQRVEQYRAELEQRFKTQADQERAAYKAALAEALARIEAGSVAPKADPAAALGERLSRLEAALGEQRHSGGTDDATVAALDARLGALERRLAQATADAPNVAALEQRLHALELRPTASPATAAVPPRDNALLGRVGSVELLLAQSESALAAQEKRLRALEAQPASADAGAELERRMDERIALKMAAIEALIAPMQAQIFTLASTPAEPQDDHDASLATIREQLRVLAKRNDLLSQRLIDTAGNAAGSTAATPSPPQLSALSDEIADIKHRLTVSESLPLSTVTAADMASVRSGIAELRERIGALEARAALAETGTAGAP